jgi:hypothetical protein
VRGEVGGEMHPVGDAAGCGLSWMLAAECGGEWRPVLLLGRLCDYGPGLIPNTAHFPLGGQGLLMLRKKPQARRKKKSKLHPTINLIEVTSSSFHWRLGCLI